MTDTLSSQDVLKVADLARLDLSVDETNVLRDQLNNIVRQFDRLQELDTSGVVPTAHSGARVNVLRDDIVLASLPRNEATRNAPDTRDGNFIVPQVLEQ